MIIKNFKKFNESRSFSDFLNKRNIEKLYFKSSVLISIDFSEEEFWRNAYSERELKQYLEDIGLSTDFLTELELDNDIDENLDFSNKLEKFIKNNYDGKFWDFYDTLNERTSPSSIFSSRESKDLYKKIRNSFNEDNLHEYSDIEFIKSIKIVGDNFLDDEYLIIEVQAYSNKLNNEVIGHIKSELEGQFSDGWGEGFEQNSIKVRNNKIFVHTWDFDNYEIEQIIDEDTLNKLGLNSPNKKLNEMYDDYEIKSLFDKISLNLEDKNKWSDIKSGLDNDIYSLINKSILRYPILRSFNFNTIRTSNLEAVSIFKKLGDKYIILTITVEDDIFYLDYRYDIFKGDDKENKTLYNDSTKTSDLDEYLDFVSKFLDSCIEYKFLKPGSKFNPVLN